MPKNASHWRFVMTMSFGDDDDAQGRRLTAQTGLGRQAGDRRRALLTHPDVAEVAVVGVPHPRWVETSLAVVVAAEGTVPTEAALIAHCRATLTSFKRPSAVVFESSLPRNAAGKVLRRELRQRCERH